MRSRVVAMVAAVVLAAGVSGTAGADGNQPPVAVDDPGVACGASEPFGGSFPIPEDFRSQRPSDEDWFAWFGSCSPVANDLDPDGDPLTVELVGTPSHGQAMWLPGPDPSSDLLLYKADPDWSTLAGDQAGGSWISDEIHYRVSDGQAWSNVAAFRVWIAPINDPPSFTPGASLVEAAAYGDPVSVRWATDVVAGPANESDQHVSFELAYDTSSTPSVFAVPPAIDGDGVLTFTPGTEPGLVTIEVTAVDDGGLEDYGLPAGGMVPPDDRSDPATFQVVVGPAAPMAPIAVDDDLVVTEDEPAMIEVVANDVDPNGDSFLVVDHGQGARGSVDVGASGILVYTPDPDANGSDAFDYTIDDLVSGRSTATVHVTILPVNDPPTAADDSAVVAEGSPATVVDVLANDSIAPDTGETLAVQSVGVAAHGTTAIHDAGAGVTYAPDAGYAGPDSFGYTISDGNGGTATANVVVTVVADTSPPMLEAGTPRIAGTALHSRLQVRLDWSATDDATGVARYQLQERLGDGSWHAVALATPVSTSVVRHLEPGVSAAYRVRARDGAGNLTAWSDIGPFTPRIRQETDRHASFSTGWTRSVASAFSGGSARWTRDRRRVTFQFRGTAVAWVGRLTRSGGTAEIRVDGVLVATVSTRHATRIDRAVVARLALATGGVHTLEIRALGDGRVVVDAFVALR